VYDALISQRVYKAGMPHEQAAAMIVEGRGTHFDPDIVDAFLAIADEFQEIAARFADSHEALQEEARRLAIAFAKDRSVLGGDEDFA